MTLISIITTSFNAGKTIKRTIDSIASQVGEFEIEYIITDAGSTDQTIEIISSYSDKVRLVAAAGLNQSEGINAGLKLARGEIVAFLNADDTYEDGAFTKVVEAFKTYTSRRWLIGRCRIIDEQDREIQPWITAYKNLLLKFYSYPLLLTENFICQPAVFFKRDVLEEYGYFAEDQHYVMDYEYWLRLGRKETPIILSDYIASFRRFAGTKSNSGYLKQFKDDRNVAKKYALNTGYSWTIPIKYLNYLKTIGMYRYLYR